MIKNLILKNFQIHEYLSLNFDSNFIVITGSNDSGKSSIIRAINWVFYNNPSGDWMRRIDKKGSMKTSSVKIVFSDGKIIKRIKGKGINKYLVHDGKSEETYENFGHGVPDPVIKILKINKFKTNKESFNIHVSMQEDQLFLLHDTSTVKASVLDTLTGMSIVQKAISDFNKSSLNINRDCGLISDSLQKDKNRLENFENLSDIKMDELEKEISHLENKKSELEKITILKDKNKNIKKNLLILQDLDIKFSKEEKYLEDINQLNLKLKISQNYKNILKKNKIFENLYIEDLDIDDKLKSIETLKDKLKRLNNLENKYKSTNSLLKQSKKDIKENDEELVKIESKIKVCPTCGKVI